MLQVVVELYSLSFVPLKSSPPLPLSILFSCRGTKVLQGPLGLLDPRVRR
jgi:hypothetical protein